MMLKLGHEYDRIGRQRQAIGELVEGLGGVLAEDDRVGAQVSADKAADDLVRLVVGHSAQPGLKTGASVDAGIVRHEALYRLHHVQQRRCAGRIVQVDVGHGAAVQQRHLLVYPQDSITQVQRWNPAGWVVH